MFHNFPNPVIQGSDPASVAQQIAVYKDCKWIIENERQIRGLANAEHLRLETNGWGANNQPAGPAKCWWSEGAGPQTLVFVEQDAQGNYLTVPYNESDPGLQWVSRETGDFYRGRPKQFQRWPKFVKVEYTEAQAKRVVWRDGVGTAYPIGRVIVPDDTTATFRTTHPRNIFWRVNPENPKQLQWIYIADWVAQYPTDVALGGSKDPDAILAQVQGVYSFPVDSGTKVQIIREIVS
jgi:hypothetical protein